MESEAAPLPLSDKLWTWFETNKQQALYGAIILLGGGIIAGFIYWRQSEEEVAAGEALTAVSAPHMGMPGARPNASAAYLKVATTYPKSSAGIRAALLAGTSLYLEGKYQEAKTQFDKFARDHRDSGFLGQALLGAAASLDAQGKSDEAITAYKNLVDRHAGENVIPDAKFALARLYQAKGEIEQARALYEDIVKNDPFRSSIGDESAMRLEELRIKYPPPMQVSPSSSPLNVKPTITLPQPTVSSGTTPQPAAPRTNTAPITVKPTNSAPAKP